MSTAPVILQYEVPGENVSIQLTKVARPMLLLSFLSPCCVAVCFATIAWGILGGILHLIVFSLTIWTAVIVGRRLGPGTTGRARRRFILDLIAGLGLLGVALVPVGMLLIDMARGTFTRIDLESGGAGFLSIAYLLMGSTTTRHLLLYRDLADWARQSGRRGLARSCTALGWVKLIYEAIWLCICGAVLMAAFASAFARNSVGSDIWIGLAVAAFAGCFGYGAISIWSIVTHAQILALCTRRDVKQARPLE